MYDPSKVEYLDFDPEFEEHRELASRMLDSLIETYNLLVINLSKLSKYVNKLEKKERILIGIQK